MDWLDHQLAARELLPLDVANTHLVVEHEYPAARIQDRERLKPILQGSLAFVRHIDEAAACMYALQHVALRVSSLEQARPELPPGLATDGRAFDVGEGLRIALVEAPTDVDYDLDHVALLSADPERTAAAYERLGFERAVSRPAGAPRVAVGGAFVEFHEGDPGDPERPLLNHLAVLVDSAEEHRAAAEVLGVEVADFVDAPNTLAVFLWGPERVKIEYVEHKPSFSLT